MAQDNYALLTRVGRLKEAQRMAGQAVPAITHMVFGDMDRSPTGGEAALGHEVHRAALTGWGIEPAETAAFFDCYVPAAIGGFVVREVGLIDASGDLIAIGRRSPGLPKVAPENGGGDDLTFRMDVFFDDLDTLVVSVSPIAGLTADNLDFYLHPNNLPIEGPPISSAPGAPVDKGQWLIAANPTGIWAGKAGQIARWRGGVWRYEVPRAGREVTYESGGRHVRLRFDNSAWGEVRYVDALAAAGDEMAGPLTTTGIFVKQGGGSGLQAPIRIDNLNNLMRIITMHAGVVKGANLEFGLLDGVYDVVTTWLTATETRRGIIELATLAEARAMLAADLAITPALLRSLRSDLRSYDKAVFNAPGSFSWTVPASIYRIGAQVWAGGGGGGGAQSSGGTGGGGGGGYSEGFLAVTPGQILTGLVGVGGTAGVGSAGTSGGNGGASSIGGISCTGGGGGLTQGGTGGTSGTGSGGTINLSGGSGYTGTYLGGDPAKPIGGNGAPSYLASIIPAYVDGTGVDGFGPGSGGSGSSYISGARNGGKGAGGQIILTW